MFENPQPAAEPPFCKDCEYLLGRRDVLDTSETWKCASPKNIVSAARSPVTGRLIQVFQFDNCYLARGSMSGSCGPTGLWFSRYIMTYVQPRGTGGKPSADDLLAELERQ